jgi:hypothetical protein
MSGSIDSISNTMKYVRLVLGILLILAIIGLPYDFYIILRVIGFVVFSLSSYQAYKGSQVVLMILWLTSAVTINPFFPIGLSRFTWQIIDGVWVLLIIYDYAFNGKK